MINRIIIFLFNIFIKIYDNIILEEKKKYLNYDPTTILDSSSSIQNLSGNKKSITVGAYTVVKGELLTFNHGGKIDVGNYSYIGSNSKIWSSSHIIIGDRVLISHNVNIHDTNSHPINHHARHLHFKEIITKGHPSINPGINSEKIYIGDDVWIGFNVTILKGVKIGNGAIISANCIIDCDIPEFAIVKPKQNLNLIKIK